MKKVFLLMMVAVLGVMTANAQFEKGVKTIEAKTSAFDLNFGSDHTEFNIGLQGSYFVIDNLAIKAGLGYEYTKDDDFDTYQFDALIGANYYFYKLFYGGIGLDFFKAKHIDFETSIKLEVGATYYITQNVFLNPAVYYKSGFGNDRVSRFGIEAGIGVNF